MSKKKSIAQEKYNDQELIDILYPRRFERKADLDAYLSGDRITCLICDKSLQNLSKHITSGHGCSTRLYKTTLNIPLTTKLATREFKAMRGRNSKIVFDKWPEEKREWFAHSCHNPEGKCSEPISTIAKNKKQFGLQKLGLTRKGTRQQRIVKPCCVCEKPTETGLNRKNRIVYCAECNKNKISPEKARENYEKTERYKKAKIRNGIDYKELL